jgi:hypothetical protein
MFSTKVSLKDVLKDGSIININDIDRFILMSINRNKRDLLKRDQALNDSTSGQLGEEPRPEISPTELFNSNTDDNIRDLQVKAARKRSRDF